MDFADRLLAELDVRGMRQAELARRLDVSPQAVSQWVTRKSEPGRDTLVRLEDLLDLNRGELLALLGFRNPDDEPAPLVTLEEAIRSDESISPENKRALLRFVKLARAEAEESVGE
ncbi:MAG: helix-turn-helix domain-containing protein [Candidatus Rokuibacteriota bacterium]